MPPLYRFLETRMSLNRRISLVQLESFHREHDDRLSCYANNYRIRSDGAPDRQYSPNLLYNAQLAA